MGDDYHIGWFSTGRGEGSRDLLRTVRHSMAQGEIAADISFVFSNREPGQAAGSDAFFELVRGYGIPLVCLSSKRFRDSLGEGWRPRFEGEAMRLLDGYEPHLCVLAGYMLIVGEEMCRRFPMINLHPAAPGGPKGTWREVIWQLIAEGATETGAMMHRVTPQLDEGPAVTYCTFSLRGEPFDRHWEAIAGRSVAEVRATEGEDNPLFALIRRHGRARELPLIVATIRAFSEGRVRIGGDAVVDAAGTAIPGYDVSAEIDELVRGELGA